MSWLPGDVLKTIAASHSLLSHKIFTDHPLQGENWELPNKNGKIAF